MELLDVCYVIMNMNHIMMRYEPESCGKSILTNILGDAMRLTQEFEQHECKDNVNGNNNDNHNF